MLFLCHASRKLTINRKKKAKKIEIEDVEHDLTQFIETKNGTRREERK